MLLLFDEFWKAYPNRKGKGAAAKKYEKIDADTHKQILLAIEAQKKYRLAARTTGEFMPDWCMPITWLNQQRWLDEIPSHAALKEKAESKKCHCGAGFPCDKHFYDTLKDDWRKQAIIEEWNKLGCPRTQADCIEVLRQAGKLNLLLILKRPPGKRSATITKLENV